MTNVESYQEKLRSPKWQKKRLRILERDNWSCQVCLDTHSTLHVHHTRYFGGDPWEVRDEYLITLCQECHEREEEMKCVDLYDFVDGTGLTRLHLKNLLNDVREVMISLPDDRSALAIEFVTRVTLKFYNPIEKFREMERKQKLQKSKTPKLSDLMKGK